VKKPGFFRAAALAALLAAGAAHAAGKSHTVTIEGMKFVPERLEIAPGDTVTWVNKDFVPHTVTAAKQHLESGELQQGKSWKYKARTKGEIDYICRLHPVMHGVLVVK
jgi:plastocyanin